MSLQGETPQDLRGRTLHELFSRLSRQVVLLVRQEIDLAKAELSQQARVVGFAAVLLAAATLFGVGAFAAVTTALILAIGLALPGWAAALLVAFGYGVFAGLLALFGMKRIRSSQLPAPQTLETIKENVEWAKSRAKSASR